jgi:phospholipid/cholesterol/gamma-HCH transport system substrate-binding protein
LKVSKEFKTGLVVILSTLLLIYGVNYLKGNSFFGGDDIYYAYFPTSGSLLPSNSVTLNGVEVGKVLSVQLVNPNQVTDANKRVLVTFSIQTPDLKLAVGSKIEIVPSFLSTGIQIEQNFVAEQGFHRIGDTLVGTVSQEITEQIESQLLPLKQKVEGLLVSVENIVASVNTFWDTSAASTMDESLNEVRIAISRFGRVAYNLDNAIVEQKGKFNKIVDNVESITVSFKQTEAEIQKVVGNVAQISDSILTSDFKSAIQNATTTMRTLNTMLEKTSQGEGTLGKLLEDEALYEDLKRTNQRMQELVEDIKIHPERYIHMSVFGARTKGVPLTNQEEKKLKSILDTIPNK